MTSNSDQTYKACYYERVSTQHQDESLKNQRDLLESYLKRHPEIVLEDKDIFSEVVSGKSDSREEFQRMLAALTSGEYSYVLIKDFKRISRSTEVSAKLKNLVKEYGFKFILLSTGQVYDPNRNENRMMYGFESLVNEEYVYRQSELARLSHRQKCEAKRLNRNNVTFGFTWDDSAKQIAIHPEEAAIVRRMFDMYVFRNATIEDIRKMFAENGYHYSAVTIRKYLQETAYIGIFHINKKGSELGVGAGKHTKRYTNPKDEWVSVYTGLNIVEKEVFDLAQTIRESRGQQTILSSKKVRGGRFSGTHLFASKVFCAECGSIYRHKYSDRKRTIGTYRDTFNSRVGNEGQICPNIRFRVIYEQDLIHITNLALKGLIDNNAALFNRIPDIISKAIYKASHEDTTLKTKKRELTKLEKRSQTMINRMFTEDDELILNGMKKAYHEVQKEIQLLQNAIDNAKTVENSKQNLESRLQEISRAIGNWEKHNITLTRSLIDILFEKYLIHKDGLVEVRLKGEQVLKFSIPSRNPGKSNSRDLLLSENALYSILPSSSGIEKTILEYLTNKRTEISLNVLSFSVDNSKDSVFRSTFTVIVDLIINN